MLNIRGDDGDDEISPPGVTLFAVLAYWLKFGKVRHFNLSINPAYK